MELKNCKRCNKLFQYVVGKPICPLCKQREEEAFQLVKDFLRENPKSSLAEVHQETKVSIKQIEEFIREERIEVSKQSYIVIHCERCGEAIYTGKYCSHCKTLLSNELKSTANALNNDKMNINKPKFHTSPTQKR